MTNTNTTLLKLFGRFFILAVLIGVAIFVTPHSRVRAQTPNCATDYDNCIAICTDSSCLESCLAARSFCIDSGGTEGGCDALYGTCGGMGSDSATAECFADYSQCLYATNVIHPSHWLGQEYDSNCVAEAMAMEQDCFNGGNPWCVNQTTQNVNTWCCITTYRRDHEDCLIY